MNLDVDLSSTVMRQATTCGARVADTRTTDRSAAGTAERRSQKASRRWAGELGDAGQEVVWLGGPSKRCISSMMSSSEMGL